MTTATLLEPETHQQASRDNETRQPESKPGFDTLGLSKSLLASLTRTGYLHPTPIQSHLIPYALTGKDCIGQAQTGTGKTAAYLLPFMNRWRDDLPPGPHAIILAPTRELVSQVAEEANKISPSKHLRTVAIYGGQNIRPQMTALKKGAAIVVGTPGRILDHISRGTLRLEGIQYAVLDEADRMLDIGFRPDIEKILRRCPKERQTLLMSATMPETIKKLIHRYMVDPLHINIAPESLTVDRIEQSYFTVEEDRKFELLLRVIARERPRQCIIFCQRKKWADGLHNRLSKIYRGVAAIHGDLAQSQRERIMQDFRDLKIRCLIATDVVSRGIDVSDISHIINYDMPDDLENYVHRIGRTGRMGRDGIAISFVAPDQGDLLTGIELTINRLIREDKIEGFEAFRPRVRVERRPEDHPAPKPVYGRQSRKYSTRI